MTENFSRRQFLKLTGAGALAGATQLSLGDVALAAKNRPLPARVPIVVIVTLYGGNDGLNTVVPYLDSIYYSSRPSMSVAQNAVLPLGDGLGLNGSMGAFASLWNAGQLAIVRGVSYPNPSLSHFTSMAIWQSGSPAVPLSSGWIGRWLDTQAHDPMLAISLSSVLPPLMAGVRQSGSVLPVSGLTLPTGASESSYRQLATTLANDGPLQRAATLALLDLLSISAATSGAMSRPVPPPVNPTLVNVTSSSLSTQLDVVAKLISANAPTRVWEVSLGGFDTHADEVSQQSALVGEVATSVARFLSQINGTPHANDVTVMVYSEFGRRVAANASLGTDHGTSAPVFLAGNLKAGGFYGDQPSLSQLVQNNLMVTTDFRDIYGAVLEDLLGTPVAKILPNWSTKLPLFKPYPVAPISAKPPKRRGHG